MSKKKTHEEFVEEMALINPNIEIKGTYINNKTKILCSCKIDGYEWEIVPSSLLHGTNCPKCALLKRASIRTKTHEHFIKEMSELHPNIEVLGKYANAYTKILCRCKIDGYEWYATPYNLLSNKGCPKCGNILKKTHEQFVYEMSVINPDIEIIGTYTGARNKILVRCKNCGYERNIIATDLLSGIGCPRCKKSKGESKIERCLLENNIEYILYHKYEELIGVNGRQLSYDFYLPKFDLLIEYQGQQHYKPIDIFGGEEYFKVQQEHDKRKFEYAKTHNIKLLEIPYWDFDNIEQILESRLLKQSA